jgi:hypothetical protein
MPGGQLDRLRLDDRSQWRGQVGHAVLFGEEGLQVGGEVGVAGQQGGAVVGLAGFDGVEVVGEDGVEPFLANGNGVIDGDHGLPPTLALPRKGGGDKT